MSTKYLDLDGLSRFWAGVKSLINGKVDKETGKGLSTNDYTTVEKNKLASLVDTSVSNVTQYNNSYNGNLTADTTKTKTYTVSGDGLVYVSASFSSDGGTWGFHRLDIRLNSTYLAVDTETFDSAATGWFGSNLSVFVKVTAGDVITVTGRSNRYQSGNKWYLYTNVLAFGCTLVSTGP